MNSAVLGFSYQENGMNVVLFANSLTNKVHQRDEYARISSFLFAYILTEADYAGTVKSSTSTIQTPARDTTSKTGLILSDSKSGSFTDVAANAFYAGAVGWAVETGVTSGTSAATFSHNAACTRAQTVCFLYRAYVA